MRSVLLVIVTVLLTCALIAAVASALLSPPEEPAPVVDTERIPLADADAADRVRRSTYEPRPQNARATARVPTARELRRYRRERASSVPMCRARLDLRVTGAFRGTTDEILQWAAAKWGFDDDLFRAVAAVESFWRHNTIGDAGESVGLMQVRGTVHEGTARLARVSAAFNADYYGAALRHYYEGCARWLNRQQRGATYRPGDLWGSVGAWYAGRWRTAAAERYIAQVRRQYERRAWTTSRFADEPAG